MNYPIDATPGVRSIIDYLGHHPVRPKEEIGRAMARLGFRIPRIYDTYEDAVRSKKRFFARSEHPGELFYSGLCLSYDSAGAWADELETVQRELQCPTRSASSLRQLGGRAGAGFIHAGLWHRRLGGVSSREFDDGIARQHSLSYWEAVDGPNYYVCADNGRPGRLYVGRCDETKFWTIDDGRVVKDSSFCKTDEEPPVEKLMELYQRVHQAELVDGNVAHIVECADDGKDELALLQIHPTQPYQQADFTVDTDQSHIKFVRGVTPAEGVSFALKTHSDDQIDYDDAPFSYSQFESGSQFEYMLPRTSVYFQCVPDHLSPDRFLREFGKTTPSHGGRSTLLKPRVVIGLSKRVYDTLHDVPDGQDRQAWIQSDGQRASVGYRRS